MAGTYTDIVSITAPASTKYGDAVSVTVKVKNIFSLPLNIAVTGRYNGVDIAFSPTFANVGAGETYSFASSFTMPNKNIKLDVWSSYWVDYVGWVQDDYEYVNIALAAGTISRMELEYNSDRASIPASNIPQGKSGLVHIWGHNDMSSTQQMGIYWVITDPDGVTRESYSTWEAWPYTGAGGEHEFIGGRFSLDKVGTWVINVALYMNPSNPTIVDSYYGTLCSAIPTEPEITEFKIQDYVKI
jgi:hypothetical protein